MKANEVGIPRRVASGFKGCPQAAGGEGRCVRLAPDELLAGEFHNDLATARSGLSEAVVLLCRDTRQRLEPVCEMGRAVFQRPSVFMTVGNVIGDIQISSGFSVLQRTPATPSSHAGDTGTEPWCPRRIPCCRTDWGSWSFFSFICVFPPHGLPSVFRAGLTCPAAIYLSQRQMTAAVRAFKKYGHILHDSIFKINAQCFTTFSRGTTLFCPDQTKFPTASKKQLPPRKNRGIVGLNPL